MQMLRGEDVISWCGEADDVSLPGLVRVEFVDGSQGYIPEQFFRELQSSFPDLVAGTRVRWSGYTAMMFLGSVKLYLTLTVPTNYFPR